MPNRKCSHNQTLPISTFSSKTENLQNNNNTSVAFTLKKLSRSVVEVVLSEGCTFCINNTEQKVSFQSEDLNKVEAFFQNIRVHAKSYISRQYEALDKFIANQQEVIEVYLATKNKLYIDKEVDVSLCKDEVGQIKILPVDFKIQKQDIDLSLLECVFFKFQNQEVYTFKDLCSHPFSILLPWEMVEPKKIYDCAVWSSQALRADAVVYKKDQQAVQKLVSSLVPLVADKKVDLFLVEKPYDDRGYSLSYTGVFKISEKIDSVVITDVLFEKGSLVLKDRELNLDLDYSIDLSKARMMDSVFHLRDQAQLYLTREDEIREEIKNLFAADKIRFKLKSLSFKISEDNLKKTVSYSDSFYQNPIDKIKSIESLFPVPIDHDLNVKALDAGKLNLVFSSAVPSKVELRYPNLDLDPNSHLMSRILKVLLGVKGGVAGYLAKDAANIAIKGNKRLGELKLLKSSGFFSFILMEVISSAKRSSELDQSKFWEKLDKVILKLVPSETGDVSDVVSNFFVDYVDDCVQDLFERENYELLQVLDSQVAVMSSQKIVFNFIEPFLSTLAGYYKANTFILDQFKDLKIIPNQSVKEGLSLELQSPFPLNVGSFIKENQCILNEDKIKVMKKDSFKAEFKVVENKGGKHKIDWFELDPKYYFDGVEISEEEAKSFRANSVVRHNGQVFFIPEKEAPVVKWLNYFWDRVSLGKKSNADEKSTTDKDPHFYRSHVLDILALRQAGVPIEGGERWQALAAEYDSLGEPVSILMEGFVGELKAFQKTGVSWLAQLYKIGLGGILADDMGLGKTVQILAFLNHLRNLEKNRLHLIVVPTSLIHNWKSEAEKFTPDIEVFNYKSGLQNELRSFDSGIVLVTYGLLTEHQELFQDKKWDVLIFDEAQQLKNIKSMRAQAARTIEAKAKICLTGTPMENHYGEFYSLIDLSVPGALGEHSSFMKVYGPRKVNAGSVGKAEIDYLKLKSKPLVLRRTKDEVLTELPEKTESIVKIDFDDQQREIYRNVALSWNSKVQKLLVDQGESKSQIQMFAALMKLRQVCSCPDVVVGSEYKILSPKLSLVVERAEELLSAQKSVLIFTNFISTLDSIKSELQKRGLEVLSITGKDSQKKREQTINSFNDEGHKALVMTLKTGGVGLNLTKANYIIHVEPWWNPAAENQGTDRAHRIGQKQSVHVYRYIMNNSIEEKIQTLKESKQEAFNMLLVENENSDVDSSASFKGGSGLTKKDFEYLLS